MELEMGMLKHVRSRVIKSSSNLAYTLKVEN